MSGARRSLLLVVVGFAFFCLYFSGVFSPFANPNELSRFQTVVAMAENGTFAIDRAVEQLGDHEDKAVSGGHSYSNKAPGVAFAALPVYRLLRVFLQPPRSGAMNLLFFLVRLLTISTVCTFAVWRLGRRLAHGPAAGAAPLVILAVAFGTPYLFYARSFFSHAWTAALLFLAWDVVRGTEKPVPGGRVALRIAGAGLLAGWALISEYTVAPIVLFLVLRAMSGRNWKALLPFAAGMAIPVGLLMVYQAICFGSPFLPSYARESFPAYAELARRKFFGLELPNPAIAWNYLFHPARGVLLFSPFLLWSFGGFVVWWRSGQERADCLFTIAATVSFSLLLAGYPNWHGGWALGSRYLLPALFFTALALPRALSSALSRGLFAVAAIFAVLVHLVATATWPHFPLDLPWSPAAGSVWFLSRGWIAPNLLSALGWLSLLPPTAAATLAGWGALSAARPLSPPPLLGLFAALSLFGATLAYAPRPPYNARLWRAAIYGAYSGLDTDRAELRRVALEAATSSERRRAMATWRLYGPSR